MAVTKRKSTNKIIKKGVVTMMKAESVYTSRKMNQATHEERKAVRAARRQANAFDRFAREIANENICYVNVYGLTMPIGRA